ncbi:hypothetical protein [Flavisericum labens]|uniref:hypothetical protein n=1 Tax=Flavisericum labens TaxID=3377112 RepID=UPI00387B1C9A
MVIPIFIKNYEELSFFGLIIVFISTLFALFSSKNYLRINNEFVEFESKSFVPEFNKTIRIRLNDIERTIFLKRQFLIFGGRSPIADADAQTLYNENRIVFLLKNGQSETILQTGRLFEFKTAYSLIKEKIKQQ